MCAMVIGESNTREVPKMAILDNSAMTKLATATTSQRPATSIYKQQIHAKQTMAAALMVQGSTVVLPIPDGRRDKSVRKKTAPVEVQSLASCALPEKTGLPDPCLQQHSFNRSLQDVGKNFFCLLSHAAIDVPYSVRQHGLKQTGSCKSKRLKPVCLCLA